MKPKIRIVLAARLPARVVGRAFLAALIAYAYAAPAVALTTATAAQAQTFATITPVLAPDRLGARAALTFTIHYAGGEFGVPSPVRQAVLQFPAGLTLDIPSLRSCSTARLETRGAGGCPRQSEVGTGEAVVEANLGAQTMTEDVTLRAFLGPPDNLQPTFEIFGQGYTPLGEQLVLSASALGARPPYGEELVMSIPPIPTLPSESEASIVSFSLTIGASKRPLPRDANTVLVPSRCPRGGFPFAAEFTYAGGATGSALATALCPR
jgi:hypothetical protein